MKLQKTQTNVKNQINIGKIGKENTIANGDVAIATGKSTKTTEQKSIWTTVVRAILAIFKVK